MEKFFGATWLIWLAFAGGFLLPWLFLLFVPFAAVAIYREFSNEYAEVWLYWRAKLRTPKVSERRRLCGDAHSPSLKPVTEMV